MTRDYARLVKTTDSTKTLNFLFDVGGMEEQSESFHYDSITEYVVNEFLPNAQNSVAQNIAKKYDIAARVCRENEIDCKFPVYEETPLEKDVLVFPCEAGRFAYLLTTVKGSLENVWYYFQYKIEAGPFGSSTENGVVPMQPSIYEGTGTNQIKLFPVLSAKIPNGTNSLFDDEIWTVLFVDWRFFGWSDSYSKKQIPTDLATRRTYTYMPDAYSVAKNLYDASVFSSLPTFSLNQTQSLALAIPEGTKIRNLEGAPLPIAVDLILACYGYRLYGGKTPLLSSSDYLSMSTNLTTDNITYDAVSVLNNAYVSLSRRPTEVRIYFRNDQYGVFTDASTGASNTNNKVKYQGWKTLQDFRFHVEKAIDAESFQSDLLYITNLHNDYSWGAWQYRSFRTRHTSSDLYTGDITNADHYPSYNLNELNVYSLDNPTETVNGTDYYTKAILKYEPVQTGSVFLDVSGNLTGTGAFSAENAYEAFGAKQAIIDYVPTYDGEPVGFWYYVDCNGIKYKCDVSNLKDKDKLKKGDVIIVSCDVATRTVFAVCVVVKNTYDQRYSDFIWFDNAASCKHRKYLNEDPSEEDEDVEITFDDDGNLEPQTSTTTSPTDEDEEESNE